MKRINGLFLWLLIIIGAVFLGVNLYLTKVMNQDSNRAYRVEINRIVKRIAGHKPEAEWLRDCTQVTQVIRCTDLQERTFWEGGNQDYMIRDIDGTYYRFDYLSREDQAGSSIRLAVNLAIGMMAIIMLLFFVYLRNYLLKPFHLLRNVPYELSKGNLTIPLKENKNRYFGNFVWGLDLLRENLEGQKEREYALQKEKKTLILSISHDIKTPLSAIKLYAKALTRDLYTEKEKQQQIAENIDRKADEIEHFVSQIIQASSGDFLHLEVNNSEFYLSGLIQETKRYYAEKLALLQIEFEIEPYRDCILKGDLNRAVEVLQNIIENAVKYGDGHLIRISVSKEEDCRLITVENSGCTLSPNELPHILESFWRGSNVGSNSGSGLGLYICRQLMSKMDGEIFACCEAEWMKVTVVFREAL